MKLSELSSGEKGVIVKVHGHGGFRKRIVEMGFITGKSIEVLHKAPLQDPTEYRIMGYRVSLRNSEAAQVDVISLEEAKHLANEHASHTACNPLCSECRIAEYRYITKTAKYSDSEEEILARGAREKSKEITVALVGNPNSGKTSLFNAASGKHQKVGNYSGVTVDVFKGDMYYKGYRFTLIDLPGTYSISAYSPEEKYVRGTIVKEKPDIILNVVDSSNLERNLFLTTQLIDMNVRMVIALNMYDELEAKGDVLNYRELERLLGVPMVPTVSTKRTGIPELFNTIIRIYEEGDFVESTDASGKYPLRENRKEKTDKEIPHKEQGSGEDVTKILKHIHINHGSIIERSIDNLREEIYKNPGAQDDYTPRYIALRLLQRDKILEDYVRRFPNAEQILAVRDKEARYIEREMRETPENAIMDAKYGFIEGALRETLQGGKSTNKVKKNITERIDDIVTNRWLGFPVFLVALFIIFQATFTLGQYPMDWIEALFDWVGTTVGNALPEGWVSALLCDGIITGVGSVLVFLPNILILFFFISLLEATGYLARAAFIMDKLMHKVGLHGRSFIPLIMGFGCNVPAIMATRTIENRNARMTTILINPLMSCNARLPIYLLLAGMFFPKSAGFVIFCLYVGGIALACIIAKIFSKFIFTGDETPFVMELPPYRVPTMRSILRDTWDKGKQYVRKIATIVLAGSLVIWALSYFPATGNLEESYLAMIGHFIQPVLAPLGFDWELSVALLSGVAAKEIVVSTLQILNALARMTPVISLAFMCFVLIYFPCIATIGAIKNETGSWKWALFAACYSILLAWVVSFLVQFIFGLFMA